MTISVVLAVSTVKHGVARSTRLMWLRWWGPSIVGLRSASLPLHWPSATAVQESVLLFTAPALTADATRTAHGTCGAFSREQGSPSSCGRPKIEIVCQTKGSPPRGYNNRVWDKLTNGHFVSDAFVDTPNRSGGSAKRYHDASQARRTSLLSATGTSVVLTAIGSAPTLCKKFESGRLAGSTVGGLGSGQHSPSPGSLRP